jgi:PPOX class probable F420-dependent enzyme
MGAMELSHAVDFARTHRRSVLVTLRANGRPQLSNVLHWVDDDGLVRISTTADRAKYHNLRRQPWAALHVSRDDFWAYAVLEGPVEVTEPAGAPDDAVVEELVAYYRATNGEHDDWDDYRNAMVRDQRAVVRLRPDHAYGALGD